MSLSYSAYVSCHCLLAVNSCIAVAVFLARGRRTTCPSPDTATLLAACPHPAAPGRHERAAKAFVRLSNCLLEVIRLERPSCKVNAM